MASPTQVRPESARLSRDVQAHHEIPLFEGPQGMDDPEQLGESEKSEEDISLDMFEVYPPFTAAVRTTRLSKEEVTAV